ncbi:hypothetical protein ACLOAV_004555 [Pseudogymnoascus australis]
MKDKNVAESPSSPLQAFCFDTEVLSIAFSPDSTRFAVLSDGQVVVFAINEKKSGFSLESKTPSFWTQEKIPISNDIHKKYHFSIAKYNVITREIVNAYPEEKFGYITAVACGIIHGKKFLIIGHDRKITYIDLDNPESPMRSVDLSHVDNFGEFVGTVKTLEMKNGNLAILVAEHDKTFTAFGLLRNTTEARPDIVNRAWARNYKTGFKYGSIALCYDGTSFITNCANDSIGGEVVHAKIYAGYCVHLIRTYNHKVDDFKLKGEVHAISCYPSTLDSKYDIFSVAGDGGEIRFFAKDDLANTFHYLEAYTTPSIWNDEAYNASTRELQYCVGDGTVIQTVFSPDGRYFVYATTQYIGVLNFKLLEDESFEMMKSEKEKKEHRENEAWSDWCEKLKVEATMKTKDMPGAFPESPKQT